MTIENQNIEKAKWLSSILLQNLWTDYLVNRDDLDWIETIFAYIRKDPRKRNDPMRKIIRRAVAQAWMRWQTHVDPYELFIDASAYKNDITLQDFIWLHTND